MGIKPLVRRGVVGAGVGGVDITSTGLWLVEKKSEGQLEMQTFPMKSRQPWARHKDVPCHQRVEQILWSA